MVGYGTGVAVSVLLVLVLLLFGLTGPLGAVAALLALVGVWTLLFGLAFRRPSAGSWGLYYPGWGLVLVALSSFYFLPARYVAALVLLCVLGVVVAYALRGSKRVR